MRLPNVPRTKLVQYDYCVVNQDWIGSKIVNIDLELPPISGAAPLPPIYSHSVEAPQNPPSYPSKKGNLSQGFFASCFNYFFIKISSKSTIFFQKVRLRLKIFIYIYWYIVYLIL